MSEITGPAEVHEAYAFACMRCGYGWEQSYEIEHHVDGSGHEYVVYKADGRRVPSPLSSPTCLNCESHVVRIMRAGQVSSVLDLMAAPAKVEQPATGAKAEPVTAMKPVSPAGPPGASEQRAATGQPLSAESAEAEHWHLSRLLGGFHRK